MLLRCILKPLQGQRTAPAAWNHGFGEQRAQARATGASCHAQWWPLRAILNPAEGWFCSPFALPLELGFHRDTSPFPASSLKELLLLFHFHLSFQWRFIIDYAVSQTSREKEYPFFLQSSHWSIWLSAKRAEMSLVPFPCRYCLFARWRHVGKPIKNQNPGAWSWVISHLFETWMELGGQLSACNTPRQIPYQYGRPVSCGMRSNWQQAKGAVRRQKCQSRM